MSYKIKWHRRLAHRLGYDIEKFNKQLTAESHLRRLLPRLNIDLVLDVGANLGQFGQMLRYLGYTGEIISFEPVAATFAQLREQAAKDPHWSAHQFALSDTTGSAEIHQSGTSDFNSLHKSSDYGREHFGKSIESAATETIHLQRFDEFAEENRGLLDGRNIFLKMDTQGHDLAVMRGTGAWARKFSGLQSEIAVLPIYEGIPTYMESLAEYRNLGYEVTGLFVVNRQRSSGHVIEFDCMMAPLS